MADFDKLSKFVLDYLSEYIWMLMSTLTKPDILFQPILVSRESSITTNSRERDYKISRIHPKIIMFFLVSVFIGFTINRYVPGIGSLPELYVSFFVVISCCIFFGFIKHILCRCLGGSGSLGQTISICLQVSSAVYLLNSFVSFLASIAIIPILEFYSLKYYGKSVTFSPMVFFIVFQYIIVSIYTLLALHRVHRFKSWAFIVFIVILLLFVQPSQTYVGVEIWQETGVPNGSGGGH